MTYLRHSRIEFLDISDSTVEIVVHCVQCGERWSFVVTKEELRKYQDGALIQDAFPQTAKEFRELLISGICAFCWFKLFPPEEEDDEDPEIIDAENNHGQKD